MRSAIIASFLVFVASSGLFGGEDGRFVVLGQSPAEAEESEDRTAAIWEYDPARADEGLVQRFAFPAKARGVSTLFLADCTERNASLPLKRLIEVQEREPTANGPRGLAGYVNRLYRVDFGTWSVSPVMPAQQAGYDAKWASSRLACFESEDETYLIDLFPSGLRACALVYICDGGADRLWLWQRGSRGNRRRG